MAQFHHVVYFDTATESWGIDSEDDAYFPDGQVWDYAGSQEWERVPEAEVDAYVKQITFIVDTLNAGDYDTNWLYKK